MSLPPGARAEERNPGPIDVSVLGRIGYDLYAEDHGRPLKDVERFSRYLGGSSANMAVGLARLGLRPAMIGCVGADALGDYLIEYLEKEQVATRHVTRKEGYLSSLCLTEVSPPDHFPQVFYRVDPADVQVRVGPAERATIESSRLFITNGTSLCGSPSRESTYRAMEWAQQAEVRVAFDVDYRAMSWPSPEDAGLYARLALGWIDILIANPLELRIVSGREKLEDAILALRDLGIPLLAAKLGEQGTRVIQCDRSWFLPPYPVEVSTTIGAGDGFASGFLFALTAGMSVPEALCYGNAAAAIVVSRLMCSEAMPTRVEVESLLARFPDRKPEAS